MSGEMDKQLQDLKGFAFDGDTGRTLNDLYEAVNKMGGTKDAPFVRPFQLEGHDRPAVVNSYLDPEGRRYHVIWYSDKSGLSHVSDVIPDAPSLAKEERADSCGTCADDMHSILQELQQDS